MNSTVLARIIAATQKRLDERKRKINFEKLKELPHRKPQNFSSCFNSEKTSIIAEIKFQSPSEGVIHKAKNPEKMALDYLKVGASALSILTEEDFFGGHLDYLRRVREAHPKAYILMKDFIIDEYQIYEGLDAGADCILLILAALGLEKAKKFQTLAQELGLSTIVEVHNEEEMSMALEIQARIVGINNRDLKTLTTSLDVSRRLIKKVPKNTFTVCESGIETPEQIQEMKKLGFNGFLVGTSLMRAENPGRELFKLIESSS
jgi:indole-3-glycerol phosphate synthase